MATTLPNQVAKIDGSKTLSSHASAQQGFTLIEVLIALTIVSMAIPAIIMRMQSVADNTAFMEEKMVASWVASNLMNEVVVDRKLQQQLAKGRRNDTIEYLDREWYWQIEPQQTELPGMWRFDVYVGRDNERTLATLSWFMIEKI